MIGNQLLQINIISSKTFQSAEYFLFAGLVAAAAIIFIILSIFYYEYVPEGQFAAEKYKPKDEKSEDSEKNQDSLKEEVKGQENEAFEEVSL